MSARATVIVPTRNKLPYLRLMLASLARQTERSFELVIVNDGNDPVNDYLERFRVHAPGIPARVAEQRAKGNLSAARNRGARESSTDVCIFVDDDMILAARFVAAHLEAIALGFDVSKGSPHCRVLTRTYPFDPKDREELLASPRALLRAAAGDDSDGREIVSEEDVLADRAILMEASHAGAGRVMAAFSSSTELEMRWLLCGGGNIAYRRELFDRIAGFDESFAGYGLEDLECGYRAAAAGARFTYTPAALACHQYHPRDRRVQLMSTFRNWRAFVAKHDAPEIWLWLSWRVLKELSITQYNELVRGYRRGDAEIQQDVGALIARLARLTVNDLLRIRGLDGPPSSDLVTISEAG